MSGQDLFDQAADWLDDADTWDSTRRAAFFAWLEQSPAHLVAARRVAQVMNDPVVAQALAALPAFPANDRAEPSAPPRRARWMPVAAALGGLAVALGVWGTVQRQESAPVHLATRDGQTARSDLADGSTVQLDPATTLDVQLSPHVRDLHLAQGRALFTVAHAPDRPFTVHSPTMAVTAIGTVFSVDTTAMGSALRVEQGRVRVQLDGQQEPLFISAGEGLAIVPGKAALHTHFHADPSAAADPAWLVSDGEPLALLVTRLQRHASAPLALAPELAETPVSGRYSSADPVGSLRLIAMAHGWHVLADGAGWRLAR